ncbi:DUF4097 family beta strand repeat-containing protein [Maribacter aestuarii]|uniref:DUF4097 family beta strand repeat-containing protein n=1 Tax=Maribacter aestuarii TaxID=1130723 RepID=UPI00248C53D8|nr:DUF4097 family beta strand repeat-containing protein [Maribacter aestuarii]
MKYIKQVIIGLLFVPALMFAQEETVELFTVPLSSPNEAGKLVVEQVAGSIDVIAYEGKEVIVKASFGNRKEHYVDENAKNGLKRIENNSLKIGAEEKDNVVQIINEQWNKVINLEIKVPTNFSLKLGTVNKGNISVTGVSGEFEISNVNGEITLTEVNGSASADTVNGDIDATFKTVTAGANMAFSSLNGDLNITFPKAAKGNLKLKSEQGDIYTDFDMVVEKKKAMPQTVKTSNTYKVKIDQWVNGKINGGGPEMLFKTFNGDIVIKSW